MYRTTSRLFAPSLRPSTRVNVRITARSPRATLIRRMMSSESHSTHGSTQNDRPWIIGSALVFGPLFLYLVSPSARKGTHAHTDYAHHDHHSEHKDYNGQHVVEPKGEEDVKPIADDEGTQVSGQEVKESMQKALESDSPKGAQEREEEVAKADMTAVAKAHPQEDSSPDGTLSSESETNGAPTAVIGVDDVARGEMIRNAVSDVNEPTTESQA